MNSPSTADDKQFPSTNANTSPVSETINDDRDLAFKLVGDDVQSIDPAVEARVVRKIDLMLLPTMFMGTMIPSSLKQPSDMYRLGMGAV